MMTRERREEVVLIALVASVAVHVGLMLLVRSQVMTHALPASMRQAKPVPMRVARTAPRPDPVKIDEVLDSGAVKDAPSAEAVSAAKALAPSVSGIKVELPSAATVAPKAPEPEKPVVFDARPAGIDSVASPVVPLTRIETPKRTARTMSAPESALAIPSASFSVAAPTLSAPTPGRTRFVREAGRATGFTPAAEVYAKVDEKIVADEKGAVRALVEADGAEELVKFVNVAMTATRSGAWRYFKVMLSPRANLPIVPKDVVMVIDGSGSIGKDRFGSCRAAARRILRSATNTGDRFNLVVFRNAFSYAFRTWRTCDAESFAAGDRWLSREVAHGRTDVFSTISSVLTLPRDPKRPLVALVVTDGDANAGVSDTAEILSRFTALNDGLVSVYMYGVKSAANRELIDVLTHGNRGESFIFEGWRWNAGADMEGFSERFRDPVLSDLRLVFASATPAEAYPRLLRNAYRGGTVEFVGRVPAATTDVSFSLKGLNGETAYEGFFKLPLAAAPDDPALVSAWEAERAIDRKLR